MLSRLHYIHPFLSVALWSCNLKPFYQNTLLSCSNLLDSQTTSTGSGQPFMLRGCTVSIRTYKIPAMKRGSPFPGISFPTMCLTGFKLFSKPVAINARSVLKQQICFEKKITLKHNQTVFSIEYAALDYSFSKNINYEFKRAGRFRKGIGACSQHYYK